MADARSFTFSAGYPIPACRRLALLSPRFGKAVSIGVSRGRNSFAQLTHKPQRSNLRRRRQRGKPPQQSSCVNAGNAMRRMQPESGRRQSLSLILFPSLFLFFFRSAAGATNRKKTYPAPYTIAGREHTNNGRKCQSTHSNQRSTFPPRKAACGSGPLFL